MHTQYLVGIVVVLALVGVRLLRRRSGGTAGGSVFSRSVKVDRLWIAPAVAVAFCAAILAVSPAPSLSTAMVWLAALAVGAALGWVRGKSLRLEVHPETAEVRSHAGGAFVLVILVLVVLRGGLRFWLVRHPDILPIGEAGLNDAFVVMAAGIVAAQRLEMWLRARRLLAERTANLASTFG